MRKGIKKTSWSRRMKMNWKPSTLAIKRMKKGANSLRARKMARKQATRRGLYKK